MEFEHVGSHCNHLGCHQKDFLPFKCIGINFLSVDGHKLFHVYAGCNNDYCVEHRSFDAHSCVNPVVPLKASSDPPSKAPDVPIDIPCAMTGCNKITAVRTACGICDRNFCTDHRSAHPCEAASDSAAARRMRGIGGAGAIKPVAAIAPLHAEMGGSTAVMASSTATAATAIKPLSEKNAALAKKVRLTKIKSMAPTPKGMDAARAIHFEVFLVDSGSMAAADISAAISKKEKIPVWYHCADKKVQTVGKFVDVAAANWGKPNKNASTLDPSQRWHVYAMAPTGEIREAPLPFDAFWSQLEESGAVESGSQLLFSKGLIAME